MNKESKNHGRELLHSALLKSKCSKIKLKNKNIPGLATKIQQILAKKFNHAKPEQFINLSGCGEFAHKAGIYIDEDDEDMIFGKWYAEKVMEKIQLVNFDEVKDKMLPLQSPSLWHEWAKHSKEQYRQAERMKTITVTEYIRQKDEEKTKVRKEQFNKCETLTPVMDCFLEFLLKASTNMRKYFLQQLKLLLDDHSRKILPKLHAEYQQTRNQLNTLKQNKQSEEENSQISKLTKQLKIQNQQLINVSLGLEHLFREMGQIYEARMESSGYEVSQTLKDKANCLPQIMAEIMDEGHALELMDGDASHVPTLWVLAVIERLKAVCGKDAREKNGGKMFILSVLGIQSTGKSTLLNTMFGLRFNISAGRCTRGAYIQLLPLNNSLRQKIDCDYVLIVDTEGLRAPELQLEGLKHDNELATFVIGLADATIINIFGETPGDLDDILQTSLHAFIRMRKIEMNPGCMFVHQNVPDILAIHKNISGRQNFYNKLDNMTQMATMIESREGQYNSFNQIIDFNESKNVFYFPCLWKGDPPMAPVNVGYSDSAQTLKTALIETTLRKQTCQCSLENFKLRIETMWKAILEENFVLNFKNTLEVFAYTELESEYAQWSRMLRNEVMKWEVKTKDKIIEYNSTLHGDINQWIEACTSEADEILIKAYKEVLDKMQLFLSSSNHSEMLLQWRHKTEHRIRALYEECRKQVKFYCAHFQSTTLNSLAVKVQEENLPTKIEELARQSWGKNRQLTDDELDQVFEIKWQDLLHEFQTKQLQSVEYPSDAIMKTYIIETLIELLQPYSYLIIRKLSHKPLQSSPLKFSFNKELHLNPAKGHKFTNEDVQLANKCTEEYLIKAYAHLDEIKSELKHFNPSFVYVILQDLFRSVDDAGKFKIKHKFVFTPEYKVDIGLVVCAYAQDVFKETTEKLKQNNNAILKLNNGKSICLAVFKSKYRSNIKQVGYHQQCE